MRGMTVQLVNQRVVGVDPIGNPIYAEELEDVEDVLVGQPTADDVTTSISIYGKTCAFTLGIPRTDTHDWTDRVIYIFGEKYRTIGYPMRGIDANIPTRWNQNVKVERYG